jgi:hypothetical protein
MSSFAVLIPVFVADGERIVACPPLKKALFDEISVWASADLELEKFMARGFEWALKNWGPDWKGTALTLKNELDKADAPGDLPPFDRVYETYIKGRPWEHEFKIALEQHKDLCMSHKLFAQMMFLLRFTKTCIGDHRSDGVDIGLNCTQSAHNMCIKKWRPWQKLKNMKEIEITETKFYSKTGKGDTTLTAKRVCKDRTTTGLMYSMDNAADARVRAHLEDLGVDDSCRYLEKIRQVRDDMLTWTDSAEDLCKGSVQYRTGLVTEYFCSILPSDFGVDEFKQWLRNYKDNKVKKRTLLEFAAEPEQFRAMLHETCPFCNSTRIRKTRKITRAADEAHVFESQCLNCGETRVSIRPRESVYVFFHTVQINIYPFGIIIYIAKNRYLVIKLQHIPNRPRIYFFNMSSRRYNTSVPNVLARIEGTQLDQLRVHMIAHSYQKHNRNDSKYNHSPHLHCVYL